MGRNLMRSPAGTFPAVMLTLAAVLIPCGVWYAMGTRQLRHVVAELQLGAHREAVTTAQQLAAKAALALQDLKDSESERPYVHYFPVFLGTGRHCGRTRVIASPLARAELPHPISLYFQMDRQGVIRAPDQDEPLTGVELPMGGRFGVGALQGDAVPTALAPMRPERRWQAPARLADSALAGDVGNFKWHTARVNGEPTLVAVRTVTVGSETYHQGFAIGAERFGQLLLAGSLPARLLPGKANQDTEAQLTLGAVDWKVSVDPTPGTVKVRAQAATLRSQFWSSYSLGLLGALVAGSAIISLVWRSGRLARERSRFAAAAAHELRTPLAGIRLHGEMLSAGLGNPAAQKKYAQRITDEAERLGRVVSNVLTYTRDDQQRLRLHLQPGDLTATVASCLDIMAPLVADNGARLETELQACPRVAFDADAVHQIVRNLVDNAEKYTRQEGDRRIHVALRPDAAGGAVLTVVDHGPGIPPPLQAHLFRPFVNADTDARAAGLGLGLSVVHGLVVGHGGRVQHEPTPGGGATFRVTFPAATTTA